MSEAVVCFADAWCMHWCGQCGGCILCEYLCIMQLLAHTSVCTQLIAQWLSASLTHCHLQSCQTYRLLDMAEHLMHISAWKCGERVPPITVYLLTALHHDAWGEALAAGVGVEQHWNGMASSFVAAIHDLYSVHAVVWCLLKFCVPKQQC